MIKRSIKNIHKPVFSCIVCEINKTVFFFIKHSKPKIHKTITSN